MHEVKKLDELLKEIKSEANMLHSTKLTNLLRQVFDLAQEGDEKAIRWLLDNIAPEDIPELTAFEKALIA